MYSSLLANRAKAEIMGGPLAPSIKGIVSFRDVPGGTEVSADISGLPSYQSGSGNQKSIGPFGFHIHEFGNCSIGNPDDPFKAAGDHYNPDRQPHGNHAGDLPVLFSNGGFAKMTVFTNRFRVRDIVGKAVVIHQNPDDYISQPSGNSGKRLACGAIISVSPNERKVLY